MGRTLGMIGQAANSIGDDIINFTMTKRERDDMANQRLLENERWDKQFAATQQAQKEDREFRKLQMAQNDKALFYNTMGDLIEKQKKSRPTIDDLVTEELKALKGENPAEYRRTILGMRKYANPTKDEGISDSQERLRAGDYQRSQVRRLTTKLRGAPGFMNQPGAMLEDFDRPESVISFAQRNRNRMSPEMQAVTDSADVAYSSDPMELQNTWGNAGVGRNRSLSGGVADPGGRTLKLGGGTDAPRAGVYQNQNAADTVPLPPEGFPQQFMPQWAGLWQDFVEGRITEADFNDWANYYMQGGE